ncbi:MAG: 23S rRNA (uracil(1939)-C(5))-methyltransferase RlmD [Deltaproteobacteria bacterium]|nr:MAG: 23S rRNA (uracil(1939)-C(5))-methyltransferase RlmD [Deltaproteobacteria bacterium]
MEIRKGDTRELEVEKVIYGGRGLAYMNNMAIFVDKAVPGDRITAKVIRVKKNFAEAKVLEVIEASPNRIIAPCPYSDYCGGCTWQCIEYEKQLEYKHAFVEDLLNHIGKATNFQVHQPLPSPQIFGYRNKMEFSFSDKRWLLPKERDEKKNNNNFALGLHVPGTFDKIIDIEGCLLQKEKGNEILREVKRFISDSGIPVYGLRTHQGFWRYLMLRHSYFFDEWMVNIITSEQRDAPIQALASILKDRFKEIASIVNNINTRKGGTAVGERERTFVGERNIKDKIGPYTFEISANSFFQTNTPMAERLYESVKSFASLTGKETILDLYSGIGTVSIFLASQATRIIGVDISNAAITDAKRNCKLNGIDNCEFLCGDVKMFLSQFNIQPDLLITDPPRVGMQRGVIDQILKLLPGRIIYISCNPSTLARDIALLKEVYKLEEVQPIDLFPNTYHIESVARLERV